MLDPGELDLSAAPIGTRCPRCRNRIVIETPATVVVRNAVLVVDRPSGRVVAKCPRCKAWVEVPLRYAS